MISELSTPERMRADEITIERAVWPCYEIYRTTGYVQKVDPYPIWSIFILLKSKKVITATERDIKTMVEAEVAKSKMNGERIPRGFQSFSAFHSERIWKQKISEVFDKFKAWEMTIERLKSAETIEL